jgi:hypothetical protein
MLTGFSRRWVMANKPDDHDRHERIRARVREMLAQYENEVEDIILEGTGWAIQLVNEEVARVYETETEEDDAISKPACK